MKYEKNRKIAGIDELKLQKMAKILILPVIAIILVVVIILLDPKKKQVGETTAESQKTAAATSAGEKTQEIADESVAPDDKVYINDFEHYGLQRDAVPEVDELVMKYQRAKTTGDAKMLYEVFGRKDTEGMEEMQTRLAEEAKVYEAFEGTICYTTAGVEEDSYLVYISSNIRFAGIDTPAPMLTWAYVYRSADGNYYMKEPDKLNEAEEELLNKVSSSEDVTLLDSEMKTNLANAVINDAKLAALYQMWSENGGETEAAAETAEAEIHIASPGTAGEAGEDAAVEIRIEDEQ